MTREEQIEQAWFRKACQSTHCYDEKSFKEAAKWADKTMLDKVYEWLETYSELTGFDYEVIKESLNNHIK